MAVPIWPTEIQTVTTDDAWYFRYLEIFDGTDYEFELTIRK